MKQSIRYFAVGLLTSSVILLFAFSFIDKSATNIEETSTEELVEAVEADGYHVLSSSEYISLSTKATSGDEDEDTVVDDEKDKDKEKETKANKKSTDDKEDEKKKTSTNKKDKKDKKDKKNKKSKTKKKKSDKKDNDKIYKYTLNIEENMLAPTISDLLKKNKIIKNSADFNKYLEDKGYASYVQLGEHKVNSDMSYKEIAQKIAKKK